MTILLLMLMEASGPGAEWGMGIGAALAGAGVAVREMLAILRKFSPQKDEDNLVKKLEKHMAYEEEQRAKTHERIDVLADSMVETQRDVAKIAGYIQGKDGHDV